LKLIEELKRVLSSEKLVYEIVKNELLEVKEQYGDKRRTEITASEDTDFDVEDLIANEETLVSITHSGYIKRSDPSQFRSQNRGGKGIRAVTTGEEDFVSTIYNTNTHATLLVFTDKGKVYQLKVYKIPEATRIAKGKAIVNLVGLTPEEKVRAILPVQAFDPDRFVVFVTKQGTIKKTPLEEYSHIKQTGIIAINIEEGDELVSVKMTSGKDHVFLCSKNGYSIRFNEEDARPMGRSTRGVSGMSLSEGDAVVSMEILTGSETEVTAFEVLTITENGYGKRTAISEYRVQGRGGKGVLTMRLTEKNGAVMGARQVLPKDDLMLVSNKGQMIRIRVGEISEQSRVTTGVRLMDVANGEKVVSVEYLPENAAGVDEETTQDSTAH
jgi:DNA gyrase subunit A